MKIPTTLHRSMRLEDVGRVKTRADHSEDEPLELEFAFASEEPVERNFGTEELEITPKAALLERVSQGVAPLLDNHDSRSTIGRVLSVSMDGGVARARVRFSRSDAARDAVRDVVDGIRQGISFGYRVHEMKLIESGDGGDRFRVTSWELFEITLASMPADPSVGIHRTQPDQNLEALVAEARRGHSGVRIMENEPPTNNPTTPAEILAAERKRVADIETIGREFTVSEEMTRAAVQKGTSVEKFLGEIRLERAKGGEPLSPPDTDLWPRTNPAADFQYGRRDEYGTDAHDVGAVNIVSACRSLAQGRIKEVEPLLELSDHIRKVDGRSNFPGAITLTSRSFYGPVFNELSRRVLAKVTPNTSGAALVGTDLMVNDMIENFRNLLVLGLLNIRMFVGLVGNVDFPRTISQAAVSWVGENTGSGESSPAFGVISMTPKTIRSRADVTRKMMIQGTPAAHQLIQAELAMSTLQGIDLAGIGGSGVGAEPEGIVNTSGISSVPFVASSGATQRQTLLDMKTVVAESNAPMLSPGFISTPTMAGQLEGAAIDPGSGLFVLRETDVLNEGRAVGSRFISSNNVPSNLGAGTNEHAVIFGDWSDLMMGMWGTVDVMVDDITLGDSGGSVIRVFQDVDFAVRHPESFAVSQTIPS